MPWKYNDPYVKCRSCKVARPADALEEGACRDVKWCNAIVEKKAKRRAKKENLK